MHVRGGIFQDQRRKEFAIFGLLCLGYCASRLVVLNKLPIFIDEAVHIEWAQLGEFTHAWFDGKWLYIRIVALFLHLPVEPLTALRLLSATSGFLTMVACYRIGNALFSRRLALTTAALYILFPYALWHDRAGHADSVALAFGAMTVVCAINLVLSPSQIIGSASPRDISLSRWIAWTLIVLGIVANEWTLARLFSEDKSIAATTRLTIIVLQIALVVSGGLFLKYCRSLRMSQFLMGGIPVTLFLCASLLSKISSMVLVPVPLIAALILTDSKNRMNALVKIIPPVISAAVLSLVLMASGGGTQQLEEKAALLDVAGALFRNLLLLGNWCWVFLKPPIAILGICSIVWAIVFNRRPETIFLVLLLLCVLMPYLLTARDQYLYPRYLLLMLVPIAALVERLLEELRLYRGLFWAGFLVLAGIAVKADADILVRPTQARLPLPTEGEFVTGYPSGYGIKELAQFLREQATERGGINVIRVRWRGAIYLSLDLYVSPSPSMAFYDLEERKRKLTKPIRDSRPTFLITDTTWNDLDTRRASKVWTYTRPKGKSRIEVWELSQDHEFLSPIS